METSFTVALGGAEVGISAVLKALEWKNLSKVLWGGVLISPSAPPPPPPPASITVKDVKALLPQVNYRVPNMRFLKDKLQVRQPPEPL